MAEEEEEDNETVICANPDCRVADTGRCVEGFELGVCPHYGREPNGADYDAGSDGYQGVRLPTAGALNPATASSILRQGETRVIAVIGPSDSGKTSLIASLYDLFQDGPVAEVEFARSRTLHAFEQTCHDARMVSRRGLPHMNRTPFGEVSFYHLEICDRSAGQRLALLLGDRAGEEYRSAADDASIVANFIEVARADTLTILVDGERLLDAGERHNLRSDAIMMLQALLDGGALRAGSRLAVVLTKLDAISSGDQEDRVLRDFAALLQQVREIFGALFEEVASFKVAASPKTGALPRGTGLSELLTFWLTPAASPQAPILNRPNFMRVFARLRPLD
jgi:hypothetical protein